ncbi:hypothetical protein GH714_034714 [Hevea brasiliensis]|uniref:Uncharacterized protein n=1 Tax=Hevea brasiliensis TaxID=3981 RepID=A0A6A6MFI6_HEVBR|nr:hypothetical protein GH714_034714 [Hevea brasiliensis]
MGSKSADHIRKKKKNKPKKDSDAKNSDKIHHGGGGGRKIIADPRFASVHSDPRFQKVPTQKSKVAIDSRFNRIFTDKNFASSSALLDKREESDSISQTEGSESEGEAESTTDEEDEEMLYEDDLPEVEVENIPSIEDGTRRLAVVNMDWRHVRAVDLYVILCSFLPKGGEILSVSVYPSEFGLQRMKEEELHGPVGLFDDENKDGDDGDEIDEEKLRAYERSRLSEQLYKACDGLEFERSSNVLDLRFVPDSMEFKHPPRDVATEAPASYEGLDFYTKALQHSSVPISWDEDEPQRVKTLKRKFNADQLAELELKEFLASDESESDEDENDAAIAEGESDKKHKKLDKYRALIQSGDGSDVENEDEGQDMEITFNTGLEDINENKLPTVDYDDPRFSALFNSHLFSLDPTDPQFKSLLLIMTRSLTMDIAGVQLTLGRWHGGSKRDQLELGEGEHKKQPTKSQLLSDEPVANKNEQRSADVLPSKKEKHEISSLVKSLKMKSKQLQLPSNGNTRKDEKLQPRGAKEMEKPELATLVQSVKKKAKAVQK